MKNHVCGYREVTKFLTDQDLIRSVMINAVVIDTAKIERPAEVSPWWGRYISEAAGDEFMGQPLLVERRPK